MEKELRNTEKRLISLIEKNAKKFLKELKGVEKKSEDTIQAHVRRLAKRIDEQAEESRRYMGMLKEDTDSKFQALLELAQADDSKKMNTDTVAEHLETHDIVIDVLKESVRDHERRIRIIEKA